MAEEQIEEKLQTALIRLDEVWSRLIRQISADIKEHPQPIPLSQIYLLRLLDRRGALSMSDLSNSLGVSMSACTALVDRAVAEGWAERQRSSTDRRVVLVGVSPAGEQTLAQIRQARARILARYLTQLEPEEIETLVNLFNRVAESVALKQTKPIFDDPQENSE
jgi:DNA-binding MarR family transcriptional regulator